MKITKTIEVEVSAEVSFQDACKIVLEKMRGESCDEFELLIDQILMMGSQQKKKIPIVDLMKDEVLSKMKEEFTLEKIETIYEKER